MAKRSIEFIVGLFMLVGLAGLVLLAFKVSGLTRIGNGDTYLISAEFDNVGGLKVRAPVAIGGVRIGQVQAIGLDKNNFRAVVTMSINNHFDNLPVDSSASIFTQGILGSNYISISPGFEPQNLTQGGEIETTHPALVLENLIGQLIYSMKSDKNQVVDDSNDSVKEKKNASAQ